MPSTDLNNSGRRSAANPLNRLSYLRSAPNFLGSALSSPKAKFLLLDNLNPLFTKDTAGAVSLASVGWTTVAPFLGDPAHRFHGVDGKDPKALAQPKGAFWLAGQKKVAGGEQVAAPEGQERHDAFINQVSPHSIATHPVSPPPTARPR